jgi:predicted nucleic acid-binding protein
MPASARAPDLLVDTSIAIALTVADHEHHEATFRALGRRRLGLAGHAAFETFSVLTRLPAPARRTPATVARLLAADFPHSRFLGAEATAALLAELHTAGIAGGAVYDALVGSLRQGARHRARHARPARARDLPRARRSGRSPVLTPGGGG